MERLRPEWTLKANIVIIITSLLFPCVHTANHTVGGFSGWDLRSNLQHWSSMTTFYVGDDLVFKYTPIHDVVEVNQVGYDQCIIFNATSTFDDGETVIHLNEPGTKYFVCGRLGHCQRGLKLRVHVLAQPTNGSDGSSGGDQGPSHGSDGVGRSFPPVSSLPLPPHSALPLPPHSALPLPPHSTLPPAAWDQKHREGRNSPTTLCSSVAAPCDCSGAMEDMADAPLNHVLVPLIITLVIFW